MRKIVQLVMVCTVVMLSTGGDAHSQPAHSLDGIKRSWQQRQDTIKSLKLTFTEVRTQPKGYFNMLQPGPLKGKEPNPPTDLRLPGQGVLTFNEQNLRIEVKRSKWSVKELKVMETEEFSVYKDGKNTSLTAKSTIVDYQNAEIERKKRPADVSEYTYWPVTCFARGLNPTFAPFTLDDFEFTDKTQIVGGKKCVELAHKSRTNKTTQFLLLDPARDFLLLRYSAVTDERVTVRLDVNYAPDPALGWVPKSWDYAVSSTTGVRIESKQVKQEGWVVNAELEPDTFDLRLPPGTRVYDTTSGKAVQYVIGDEGKSGPTVPDSRHPTYEQLTELTQKEEQRWPFSVTISVLAGLVLAIVVSVLAWRWSRFRAKPAPDSPSVP